MDGLSPALSILRENAEKEALQILLYKEAQEKEQQNTPYVVEHAGCGGQGELNVESLFTPYVKYYCPRCGMSFHIKRTHYIGDTYSTRR